MEQVHPRGWNTQTSHQRKLQSYQIKVNFVQVQQEWRTLYPLAWADFYRFLLGWSPDHYKINPYMQQQTDIALAAL